MHLEEVGMTLREVLIIPRSHFSNEEVFVTFERVLH
jgi:hypothetical protein